MLISISRIELSLHAYHLPSLVLKARHPLSGLIAFCMCILVYIGVPEKARGWFLRPLQVVVRFLVR